MAGLWVLETILLYRLGWDFCILAVLGRWLLCSCGCMLPQVSLYLSHNDKHAEASSSMSGRSNQHAVVT